MKRTTKFKTLTHEGPVFVKPYEPTGGVEVDGTTLPPLAEEMLYAWARYFDTDKAKDAVFVGNFLKDFRVTLPGKLAGLPFSKFDGAVALLRSRQAVEKAAKANKTKEERLVEKEKNDALKAKHGKAVMDGKEQPISVYQTEPAGLFIGRGSHPLRGRYKRAVRPEDVELNVVGGPVPKAPEGHEWGGVKHNKNGYYCWVVKYTVGDVVMYKQARVCGDVLVDSVSSKFEKAQRMNQKWDELLKHVKTGLAEHREEALVTWLISNTAMRVGNERDASVQAEDVVGATTLKVKNVRLFVEP